MEIFKLDEYLNCLEKDEVSITFSFQTLCDKIKEDFVREWQENGQDVQAVLELQKRAIIGYANEMAYFKEKIKTLVTKYRSHNTPFPNWYESLEDGIFHESWGLAGIAQWFSKKYQSSSSAKIIGDRIYFLLEGKMVLMEQSIIKTRRDQLVRAFLLLSPQERLDKEFHEVYLLDGTRITVYGGGMVKPDQDAIIFRRYIIPVYSFEEQAIRGTIPKQAIPLFISMNAIGYNVAFTGAVRTAKTTFLATWQSYENQNLEGVMVETDPEIPMHKIMPDAPILQLLADDEEMQRISKNLLRSDADYFILAEARDGNALETAIRLAAKGGRRLKITFHCRDPLDFPYDAAWEVAKFMGENTELVAKKVAASFDYIFHFIQLKNKNQKRLKSIYEIEYDRKKETIRMHPICLYDIGCDSWEWNYHISKEKQDKGEEEDPNNFLSFDAELRNLSNGGCN